MKSNARIVMTAPAPILNLCAMFFAHRTYGCRNTNETHATSSIIARHSVQKVRQRTRQTSSRHRPAAVVSRHHGRGRTRSRGALVWSCRPPDVQRINKVAADEQEGPKTTTRTLPLNKEPNHRQAATPDSKAFRVSSVLRGLVCLPFGCLLLLPSQRRREQATPIELLIIFCSLMKRGRNFFFA